MKKLLAIFLIMVFLTACGKQETVATVTTVPTVAAETAPETDPETLPPETVEATTATEALPPPLELTEKGKDFLAQMCFCMHYWEQSGSADGYRYNVESFLYSCMNAPRRLTKTTVMTIAGEAELKDGEILIPWEMAEDLVKLTFGTEMPNQQYWRTDMLQEGVFHIPYDGMGEKWNYVYCLFREFEMLEPEYSGRQRGRVIFDYYFDDPNTPTGNVVFTIAAANNENGFVILEMKTDTSPEEKVVQEAAEAFALAFARKVIDGDQEAIEADMLPYGQRYTETYEEGTARLARRQDRKLRKREGQPEAAVLLDAVAMGDYLWPFRLAPMVTVNYYMDGENKDNISGIRMILAQTKDGFKVREYGFVY